MTAIRTASVSLVLLAFACTPGFASPFQQANEYFKVRERAQVVQQFKPEDLQMSPQQFDGKLLEVRGVISGIAGSEDQTSLLIGETVENGPTHTVMLPAGKKSSAWHFIAAGSNVRALCKVVMLDGTNAGILELVIPVKEHEAASVDAERAKIEADRLKRLKDEQIRKVAVERTKGQQRAMSSRGVSRSAYRAAHSGPYTREQLVEVYAQAVRYFNRRLAPNDARQIAGIILDYSVRYGLDARLVMAVIACESNFNSNAVSPVGAQGLGQLMPGTANDLGVRNSFDVRDNLEGSTRLLSQHIRNMGENGRPNDEAIKLALACYNAGAGAVKKYRGIPPYRDARNYVKKITRLYRQMCGLSPDEV